MLLSNLGVCVCVVSPQDVSHLSDIQCDRREHGPAQDVPQPALLQDLLPRWPARWVSDRRHLLCTGTQTNDKPFSLNAFYCANYISEEYNAAGTNLTHQENSTYQMLSKLCVLLMSQGVGTVVSGTTLRGLIRLNDTMLLGPDPLGSFIPIAVKSIHRKRMPVKEVRGGQTASFALKKVRWETSPTAVSRGRVWDCTVSFVLWWNNWLLKPCAVFVLLLGEGSVSPARSHVVISLISHPSFVHCVEKNEHFFVPLSVSSVI